MNGQVSLAEATVVILDRPNRERPLDADTLVGPEVELLDLDEVPAAQRAEMLARARVVVADVTEVDKDLLAQLRACRAIVEYGVGVDNIDVEEATRRGMHVVHVPDYCMDELADHAIALIMSLTRGLGLLDHSVKDGKWDYRAAGALTRSGDTTVGVVGLGKVGRGVATRLRAIGFQVVAFDPFADAGTTDLELLPLNDLLAASDVVTLHCPLTPATAHMLAGPQFRLMKTSAFLVNTARGGLVHQTDLCGALAERRIAGAALDVLEEEPPAADDPILAAPNILLTPHSGFYSEQALEQLHQSVFAEVRRALAGDVPSNSIKQPQQDEPELENPR